MKKALLLTVLLASLGWASLAFAQGPMQQTKPSPADQARLAKLEKAYHAAKAALAKAPQSQRAKNDFVTVGDAYAMESMTSPVLPPRVKYPQSLRVFREVLKVNPTDKTAKKWTDEMIRIYKSMGRPVPSG